MDTSGLSRGPLQPPIHLVRASNHISALATNWHSFFRPTVSGGIRHAEKLGDSGPTAKIEVVKGRWLR